MLSSKHNSQNQNIDYHLTKKREKHINLGYGVYIYIVVMLL